MYCIRRTFMKVIMKIHEEDNVDVARTHDKDLKW